MENSPPGIQAIPAGAEPVGGFLFSTVGAKLFATATGDASVFTDLHNPIRLNGVTAGIFPETEPCNQQTEDYCDQ